MSALPQEPLKMTEEEYLAFEDASESRHELIDGYVYDMAGSSEDHSTICTNIITSLNIQVRKRPCKVHGSDLRIQAKPKSSFFYPDITVICGESKFTATSVPSLTNPNCVIEVLSPSTEKVDRGRKAQAYREMASLQEYLFVSQDSAHIEHYKRLPNGHWELTDYKGLDAVVTMPAIECSLALADVYEKVDLGVD
jgi:Uma2 family endonuclease